MIRSQCVSRAFHTPLVGLAVVAACGFTGNPGQGAPVVDSSIDVAIVDADGCRIADQTECVGEGSKLRVCKEAGKLPMDFDCDWGCSTNGIHHCAKLVPAGGFLLPTDLDPGSGPQDVTLADGDYELNGLTGEITPNVRGPGMNVLSGIDFQVRAGKVGVFKFAKLTLGTGTIKVIGTNAVALVSLSTMNIAAEIDLQGDCLARNAGPGGSDGGARGTNGSGSGGGGRGAGVDDGCYGGGGGANGGNGGRGGNPLIDNKGNKFGTDLIPTLVGGSGGGGGGASAGADGGGGGGAIQLIAQRRVTITGGINAGGCGGKTAGTCGGGGGAGGTILIEAPVIDFSGSKLATNGGGGGGGNDGQAGERASLSNQKANGGGGGKSGSAKGGNGGDGADDNAANGSSGQLQSRCGGGGGAVGRMRFNTLSGTIVTSGTVLFSPLVSTTGATTTTTRGIAVTQ